MATVKVKRRPSTVEGKAGAIYYQIIHNRVIRQLKTEYRVFADEWNDTNGTLDIGPESDRFATLSSIRDEINRDLNQLCAIIGQLDKQSGQYTTDDVIRAFAVPTQTPAQSFFYCMQCVIARLKLLNKHRTAENYATALNSFTRFLNRRDLSLEEIDSDLMMWYEAYLIDRGITKNTTSFYMRILRAVYNRAVEQELTEQRNPFRHVYTGIDKTVKRAISFAAIKRVKELDLSFHPVLDFARDMFLFSFYTRGMSFIDMAYLRKADLKAGVITYRRRKTGQQLSIKWERCMQEIVAKYENRRVCQRTPSDSPYLLPILKAPFDNSRVQYRGVLQQINKSLKTVARLVRLDIPLTMYVARHSWASIARSKNIPVSVISEGMGHDSETTTRIYLASLDTAVIDRANSLVLKGL